MARPGGPGVFITWDVEKVDVERREAGTVRDRTVVIGRSVETVFARWTNKITDDTIAAGERYAESIKDQYDNVRVQVVRKV